MLKIILYFATVAAGAFGASLLASLLTPPSLPLSYVWLIKAVTVMVTTIALTHVFVANSGQRWRHYGVEMRTLPRSIAAGATAGVAIALVWFALLQWFAPVDLERNREMSACRFLAATLGTVAMGVAEEVGYRTFGLFELRQRFGYFVALLIPQLIFVAAHVVGGVPWPAGVLVVGSASVLFAVVMLETGSLPLVAALHVATNLMQDDLERTSDSSLFMAQPLAAPGSANLPVLWAMIAVVNVAAAAGYAAWKRR